MNRFHHCHEHHVDFVHDSHERDDDDDVDIDIQDVGNDDENTFF